MNTKLVIATMAFGLATAVSAADLPEFDTVDADNDGKITMEEAEVLKDLDFDFDKADKNDDDVVDQEEYDHADD